MQYLARACVVRSLTVAAQTRLDVAEGRILTKGLPNGPEKLVQASQSITLGRGATGKVVAWCGRGRARIKRAIVRDPRGDEIN